MKKIWVFLVVSVLCLQLPARAADTQIGTPQNAAVRLGGEDIRDPGLIKAFPVPRSLMNSEVEDGRSYWLRTGAVVGGRNLSGGTLAGGVQYQMFALDLRFTFANGTYGSISTKPNYLDVQSNSQEQSATDPSSELNRLRDSADKWSLFTYEPGFSATARLFPNALPLMSERCRFGIGWGTFTDQQNSISFSALIFTVEGAVEYQLGYKSHWALEAGGQWSFGRLIASGSLTDQAGRLPISYVTGSISLLYWFNSQ